MSAIKSAKPNKRPLPSEGALAATIEDLVEGTFDTEQSLRKLFRDDPRTAEQLGMLVSQLEQMKLSAGRAAEVATLVILDALDRDGIESIQNVFDPNSGEISAA